MRLLTVIAGLMLGLAAWSSPAWADPSAGAGPDEERRVAVIPIASKRVEADVGDALTELLLIELGRVSGLVVTGPSDMRAMLSFEEQKMLTGCDDDSCLAELAGAMGAELLVTGTATRFGVTYVIALKLIDVRRSLVLGRARRDVVGREEKLLPAVRAMVDELFGLTPAKPDPAVASPSPGPSLASPPTVLPGPAPPAAEERYAPDQRIRVAVPVMMSPAARKADAEQLWARLVAQMAGDTRFELVPEGTVDDKLAEMGLTGERISQRQGCELGLALRADRVLLTDLFRLHSRTRTAPQQRGQSFGTAEAVVGVRLQVVAPETCLLSYADDVVAEARSGRSETDAARKAADELFGQLEVALRRAFPVSGVVIGPVGRQWEIDARAGLVAGQYYDVLRDERWVGRVHVDSVQPGKAFVTPVAGTAELSSGDSLLQSVTHRRGVVQLAYTAVPVDTAPGAANSLMSGVRVGYQGWAPVSGFRWSLHLERAFPAPQLTHWQLGWAGGWSFLLVPRRLRAFAELGVAYGWGSQPAPEGLVPGEPFAEAGASGFHLLNRLGVDVQLADWLVLGIEAGWPLHTGHDGWYVSGETDDTAVSASQLTYRRLRLHAPTVAAGLGYRF